MTYKMFNLVFHRKLKDEIKKFDPELIAKTMDGLKELQQLGHEIRYPRSRKIIGEIFELRIGYGNISRTFFAFQQNNEIFILRSFVKKTQKTPQSEIVIALKRLEEMKNE